MKGVENDHPGTRGLMNDGGAGEMWLSSCVSQVISEFWRSPTLTGPAEWICNPCVDFTVTLTLNPSILFGLFYKPGR